MSSTRRAQFLPAALFRARLLLPSFTMDSLAALPEHSPTPQAAGLIDNVQAMGNQVEEQGMASHTLGVEEATRLDEERYAGMRGWRRLRKERATATSQDSFVLRMISFNILAQSLLESYPYLYRKHDERALPWERRRKLILKEIIDAQADIICLQEMQQDHLHHFIPPLSDLGYGYLYKKRTGDKVDGLLLLYRNSHFAVVDQARIELRQSGIERLTRDNVAIVAKLKVKSKPAMELVVATTHLLYNPRRNDVRLGQMQIVLAEIERIAYIGNGLTGPQYLPIILAGDFNLEPFTGVYKFVTQGFFRYEGKGRNLENANFRCLSNSLIPPRLCITDNCQHLDILRKRLTGEGRGKVMLENSENCAPEEELAANSTLFGRVFNAESFDTQTVELARGHRATFCSGSLSHPFRLRSVYEHGDEATTHQGEWITVDYIFHSEEVLPIERYTLPSVKQCSQLPTIPNFVVGSDHLCLGASFEIRKQKV